MGIETPKRSAGIALAALLSGFLLDEAVASGADNAWAYSLTVSGYFTHGETSYLTPTLMADHDRLHLEARYNYESLHTGSLWAGYNFSGGKTLLLHITPMVGAVFGSTKGIAPGCEASLTYKRLELSITNEYVFDTMSSSKSFYYSWNELTYAPTDWLRVGGVVQHTKAFHASVDVQPGLLVSVSHKDWEFTTYIFSASVKYPTIIVEAGINLP